MRKAAFIYDDVLSRHVLRDDHVFTPSRLKCTYELLNSYGAFNDSLLLAPKQADKTDLLSFHTEEYIEAVESISRGDTSFNPAIYNFFSDGDNPPYEGMYEASNLVVGASLLAAGLVADGDCNVAFNISGGLHHANPGFASGFCIFNDVVIAIKYLVEKGMRVAYVDIDAHHGDGVQDAFYMSDRVLTISIHETGKFLFPGTGDVSEIGAGPGIGFSVNIPLLPYTDDETYLWAFREVVPPVVKSFKPDILVTQLGVDTHYLDPLSHLMLTTEGYTEVLREFKGLALKWLALGGGGYDMGAVARLWTLAYGVMINREWSNDIPLRFQEQYGLKKLKDKDKPNISSKTRQQARGFAQASVKEVKRRVRLTQKDYRLSNI
jgi:acetoin utilization protein AcuC